jgi:RNA polymerase sigma-70 factor (ECF subfamily)
LKKSLAFLNVVCNRCLDAPYEHASMTSVTESELKVLMLLSLDGDEKAYRCLLDTLQHLLRAYFERRLARSLRTDVDDLVQDTLLSLHQRRITYDRDRPFTAWFFAIARHKLIDHYRKTGSRTHLSLDAVPDMPDGYREDAITAHMDVQTLLASLPAWQAEAIRRVRLDGQSIGDAALHAGRSETMVKVSIHRGIKALAARLRGEHDKDE